MNSKCIFLSVYIFLKEISIEIQFQQSPFHSDFISNPQHMQMHQPSCSAAFNIFIEQNKNKNISN